MDAPSVTEARRLRPAGTVAARDIAGADWGCTVRVPNSTERSMRTREIRRSMMWPIRKERADTRVASVAGAGYVPSGTFFEPRVGLLTEAAAVVREREHAFVRTIAAADARQPVVKHTAREESVSDLGDDGPP